MCDGVWWCALCGGVRVGHGRLRPNGLWPAVGCDRLWPDRLWSELVFECFGCLGLILVLRSSFLLVFP